MASDADNISGLPFQSRYESNWTYGASPAAAPPASSSPAVKGRSAGFFSLLRPKPVERTPQALLATTIVCGCLVLLAMVPAGLLYRDGLRSDRVQHHGILTAGTVLEVRSVRHDNDGDEGGSSYTTYNLVVQLPNPVYGNRQLTVVTPDRVPPASAGETISLLVDPKDKSYAELPGEPNGHKALGILVALGIAGPMGVCTAFGARAYRRKQAASRG